MIKLNGVEIKLDKYPDGTFLFKDIPPIGGWCRDNIEWFFESMEELTAVEYITRYCWDHRVVPNLYMPYIAMKATYGIVNGEPIMIYKDPKTDTSHLKKSHKGCCCIYYDDNGELQCEDGYNDVFRDGALSTVFVDGKACNKETFEDIRERLNGGNKDE